MLVNSIEFDNYKTHKIEYGMREVVGRIPDNEYPGMVIGIDPGVNFGLTLIVGHHVSVSWGKLPSSKVPGQRGISAYEMTMNLTLGIGDWKDTRSLVEGAAYHSKFGQVTLEEVRFGFFMALHQRGCHPIIVPPATVRLGAFGSGKQQAGDLWPLLNHNAADSLGCALYLLEKEIN